MAKQTVTDVRRAYAARLRTERYERWLELELLADYARHAELNKAVGLPENATWEQTLERAQALAADEAEYAWVRGEGSAN